MARAYLLIIASVLLFSNCRKNNYDIVPTDIGHSYLPLNLGNEFIYKADSVKYGFTGSKPNGDSVTFYIKEVVVLKIEDSFKTTFTLARYYSKDSVNWMFVKNHFYEVEKLRINHKENNLITTCLVFPIEPTYYWNGNELNNLEPKEYEYSMVNFNAKVFSKAYPNSLKVRMDSTDNLRERKIESEIFSKNVGLIYSEIVNLTLINNDSLDEKGNIVIQRPPKIEKGTIFNKGLIRYK